MAHSRSASLVQVLVETCDLRSEQEKASGTAHTSNALVSTVLKRVESGKGVLGATEDGPHEQTQPRGRFFSMLSLHDNKLLGQH